MHILLKTNSFSLCPKVNRTCLFLLFLILSFSPLTFAVASGITYQGRILGPDGRPVVNASVHFYVKVTSPDTNCILYAENSSVDMSSGDGTFSLIIGRGQRADAGSHTLSSIFASNFVLANGASANCTGGYSRASTDTLKLSVAFDDGNGFQTLSPLEITPSPFAMDTQSVAGVPSTNVLRVSNVSATPLTAVNFTELMALLNGTSTRYAPMSGGNISAPADIIVTGNATVGGFVSSTALSSLSLALANGSGNQVSVVAPAAAFSNYTLTLPMTDGGVGEVLSTNGSGELSWMAVGGTGTVTSITAGAGLTGGTINTTGTIGMPNVGTAGTFTKVTTDAQGRVSSGTTLASTDIPNLDWTKITTGKPTTVSGYGITDAFSTVGGTLTGSLTLAPATTTAHSLRIPAGAIVTTPVSGNIENDGTNLFYTNAIPNRQKILSYGSDPSNGQILIGNGLGFNLSTLTAGTGITITNSSGGVTISAPGSGGTVTSVTSANGDIVVATGTMTPVLTLNSGTTGGVGDANKIAKLDGSGQIATGMIPSLNQYALLAGRATGQTLNGGTAASENLTLDSTANATKGNIILNPTGGNVGIGTTSPNALLDVNGTMRVNQICDSAGANCKTVSSGWGGGGSGTVNAGGQNQLSYYSAAGSAVSGLATANDGVLVTSGTGVPSISSTLPSATQLNITSLGTVTTGTWQGTTIGPTYGGTGLTSYTLGDVPYASASNTLSKLSGNSTTTKKFLSQTGNGATSAAPSWGTLGASDLPTYPINSVMITNVTGTLTAGGGTTANTILQGSVTGPVWSTATFPSTTTENQLLYSSSANTVIGLTTANNGVLITSGVGAPSISSTLPSAVQGNINTTGTITSGVWNGTKVSESYGGTNQSTYTTGDLLYASGPNSLSKLPIGSNTHVLTVSGGVPTWAAGSGGVSLSGLTAATGANSINNDTNAQTWNWQLTANTTAFNITENVASTGGTGTQDLVKINTLASSTANPLHIKAGATEALIVNSSGNVGIGTTTPGSALEIAGQVKITGGSPGQGKVLTSDADGLASWANGSGGSGSISDLTGATGAGSLDNSSNTLSWNWSTASTGNQLALTANSLAAGSILSISSSNASLNSTNGLLRVANTGTSTNGLVARIQSNSGDSSSGVTVRANGKVGIGVTNPSAYLQIVGNDLCTGELCYHQGIASNTAYNGNPKAGIVFLGKADAGATLYSFSGIMGGKENTTSGNSAGYLSLQTQANGASPTEKVRIDSAGNVGIGTTTPGARLDIVTDFNSASGIDFGLKVQPTVNASGTEGYTALFVDVTETSVGSGSRKLLDLRRNGSTMFNVDRSGNLNFIGQTQGPAGSLSAPTYGFSSTTNTGMYSPASNQIGLVVGGAEKFRLDSSGNVGIGTTTSSGKLTVAGGVLGGLFTSTDWVSTAIGSATVIGTGTNTGNSYGKIQAYIDGGSSGNLVLQDAGGNVGIGTTTPGATLDVKGHIANSGTSATVETCGTSPAITGNDTRGLVTLGTASPTACTITFQAAYSTAPYCVVTAYGGDTGAIRWWITTSTTSMVINFSATPTASQQFQYHCMQ